MMTTTSTSTTPPARGSADPGQVSNVLEQHGTGLTISPEGWLLDCGGAASRMLRLPDDYDGRGLNVRQFCKRPERFLETVQAVQLAGRIENWDGDLIALDGTPVPVVGNLVGQFDEGGVLRSIRANLFDITEWRRGRQHARFGPSIESPGRMACGLAHDFSNLLTVLSHHTEALAMAIAPGDAMYRSVAAIQECSARAVALTQQLQAFVRRPVPQPRLVDVTTLVDTVEVGLRRSFGPRLAVSVSVEPPIAPVRVDPSHIERALRTIAAHAIDAMPNGGALSLRARNLEVGVELPQARASVKGGSYVRIEIACSGMGLDEEARQRKFEPFLLEPDNARDGRALAEAFGAITQSGGYILRDVERTMQSTFAVLLPVAREAAAWQAGGSPLSQTILVVDDDDELRGLIVKVLRHQGYVVHQASTPDEATAACGAHQIGLLISDVVLGGARGDELAAQLLTQYPGMRLMCISGYPEALAMRDIDRARATFLEKPFSARDLVCRVRDLLPS